MLNILADECINGNIIRALREQKYNVQWVSKDFPGFSDEQLISIAKNQKQILLSEDKDFGDYYDQ